MATGGVAFSTAGPSYLLLGVTADAGASHEHVLSVSGGGLSWTKLAGGTTGDGAVASEYWGANSSGALNNVTITVTLENIANFAINVLSLANVNVSSPVGAKVDLAVATGNLSVTLNGTVAGSMLFAISSSRPSDGEALAAGSGSAVYNQQNSTQSIRSLNAVAGGTQTFSSTGYTLGSNLEYAALEIAAVPMTHTLAYAAGSNGSLSGSLSQTVNDGMSGTAVTAVPDYNFSFSSWSDGSTQNPRTDANVTGNISVTANFSANLRAKKIEAPAAVPTPSLTVNIPTGGVSYNAGSVLGIDWSSQDGAFAKYSVSYSSDDGATWVGVADGVTTTSYDWTVGGASTAKGKIKVFGYDAGGSLIASAVSSGDFTVLGVASSVGTPASGAASTPVEPTVVGAYTPADALMSAPDINADKNLPVIEKGTINCTAGSLVKASSPAVYYCGADGKRYVFTTSRVYFSWYASFSSVNIITDDQLAQIPIGGNATYRPGERLVKAQSDPRVYAVARGGILRWIPTADKAKELYGENWTKRVDYIPDAFFGDYRIGSQL